MSEQAMATASRRPYTFYTMATRRRVIEMYAAGATRKQIGDALGVEPRAAGRIVAAAGAGRYTVTDDLRAKVRDMVLAGYTKSAIRRALGIGWVRTCRIIAELGYDGPAFRGVARQRNSPRTRPGEKRLERVRTICRLRADGMTIRGIADAIPCHWQTVRRALETPFGEALMACAHGAGVTSTQRIAFARRMFWNQGVPVDVIARAIDTSEPDVVRWVARQPPPEKRRRRRIAPRRDYARKLTADQVRAIRADRRDNPGEGYFALAIRYGVSKTLARNICLRLAYADVQG